MKVYTRRGDAGETDLFGGARVPKDHARVEGEPQGEPSAVSGTEELLLSPAHDSLAFRHAGGDNHTGGVKRLCAHRPRLESLSLDV